MSARQELTVLRKCPNALHVVFKQLLQCFFAIIIDPDNFPNVADTLFHSDASTVVWPQTTQGHGQQQPSLSVVTTVWGVTSSMTNGTANMTHDPTNPGIPTTNTVNSVGHPYVSTSANPKQYVQSGKDKMSIFLAHLDNENQSYNYCK